MEANDPANGASYYYNENTGKTQWERPSEMPSTTQTVSPLPLLEDWVEAFDEASGMPSTTQAMSPLSLLEDWVEAFYEFSIP